MNLSLKIRRAVTIITAVAFYLSSVPVQAAGLPPLSLSQMYGYAAQGNVRGLRVALQRGLNIDSVDRRGNTGLCHAITQNNYTAYNAFRSAGANPGHPCIQNIPRDQYDQFMASKKVAPITASPREAYKSFGEGEYIVSKATWVIGGLILVGGILAVALSGGGGGSSRPMFFQEPYYEPTDSLAKFAGTQVPTTPESRPYSAVIHSAFDGEVVVNKKSDTSDNNFSITNNSTTKIFNKETNLYEDKKLVDIIDLNGNILDHTAYLQVAMKARKNATVENGTDADGPNVPVITLGDATAGLVANDRSFAKNYATIKTIAQNGAISMIAGNHSVATNMGNIDIGFKGIKDSDSVIGMYADTYSSIINNGSITANTIDSGAGGATPPNAAGTIIGMEVRTINEVPYPGSTPPVTASNNLNIALNATSGTNPIGTSLVGMGGYLDKAFLDGTKLIRRASSLYLNNIGNIKLTYTLSGTGTYVSTTNTLLNGMGGIIGMRADAKTTAINDGDIDILMTSGVNNAAAGMLAVHGGTLTNNGDVNVTGGEGNYGMLSVRGKGNNSEIDSLTPTLFNNGNIHVISTKGYGMASYNGGVVTNAGSILLDNVGTGMRTNTGILDNKNNITLNNSGQGMVVKSNEPIVVDGGTGGTGGTETGGTGTETTVKEDLSKAQATNNGLITINNADNAQGIFIEDGKATNNGTGIKITNTSRVPAASSYGIKAEKGTVDNNSLIDMNVLVSADGSTSVDSYGIFTDSANINNNINGSIVFRKRGTGIASTSGRIINLGSITMEQGGTGIKSDSGDVYNAGEITIDDNDTAISTGIEAVAGKISNTGKITITGGNGATGIKAGLLVDNHSAIDLTGRNITGIELTGKDAIANNYSDINVTSTGLSSVDKFSYGIKAGSSAVNATIKNFNNINMTGTTSLTNKERGYGIFIADGSAYNYGNIIFNNMYGWGMYTTAGTLVNDAQITLGSGGAGMYGSGAEAQLTNSATGRINITVPENDDKSESYGMYASGGAIAVNKGIISINTNTNPAFMLSKSYGIYVDNGNTINQGQINIIGSNATGIAYAGSNAVDTIKNEAGSVINLTGGKLIGMSNTGGTSINAGIINLGTSTTTSTAPNSIGMQISGGMAVNQNTINVNSQNSVGLQSDGANATITNNGTINISSAATGSYGILSNAGTAINGSGGIINSNISNTDIMRASNGTIINNGRLEIKDPFGNVNAMHVTEQGTATNSLGATIMVGTSAGATGTNNTGILLDKEGSTGINNGTITVYSKDSYGMKSDNANTSFLNNSTITVMPGATGSVALYIVPDTNPSVRSFMRANANSLLINNGTINIMAGATGSIALSSVSGDIINTQKAIINMYASGIIMRTFDGTMTNEGVLALTQGNSTAMYVIDAGKAINRGSISVNGANSNAMYAEGTGILQNIKTITVNGANSNAMKSDDAANATMSNSGTINLNNGATNAKGIYNASGTSTNETSGIINVLQSAATALYTQSGKLYNKGLLNLSATNAIGIHVNGTGMGENVAGGIIDVNNSGARALYVSGAGNVVNNGIINMNANNAFGLYAENGGTATNNSDIDLGDTLTGSYAMYGQNNGFLINNGNITLGSGGGYGIYARDSAVTNTGKIDINSNISSSGIMAINTSGGGNITNSGDISVATKSGTSAHGINVTTARSININNSGNITVAASGGSGKAYGIAVNGAANITNTSSGVINATADAAYGMMLNGSGIATNQGSIIITDSISSGLSSYGMHASAGGSLVNSSQITVNSDRGVGMYLSGSGSASNSGAITVNDNGSGNAIYGMQANGSGAATNSGSINITGGNAYGMYSSGGASINNSAQITVSGGSVAYGMYVNGSGTANNSGTLNVSGGSAYGMYVNGSGTANNSGTINVSSGNAYGMYASNGGSIVNNSSATINVTGSGGVGMYADGSGSSITNNGNIIINGSSIKNEHPGESTSDDPDPDPVDNPTGCTASGCGNFIKVSNGATFTNNSVVRSYSALDFSSMIDETSSIELGKGGSFEAPAISGRVRAAASIVQEGNAKTYTNEDSFVGEDEGIILDSGSYLFDVRLVKNAEGNHDVVMNMKDFKDVVDNQKIAGFLSANYDLGNRLDIFSDLKAVATAEAFGKTTAEQLGLNLMPSFAKQNLDIIKSLDRHLNTTLFNNNDPKDLRASINYAYDTRKQDGIDMLSGYEDEAHSIYGLFDRKYNNNFRYGFGLSLTDYSSEYDHGAKRDEVIAQVLAPLIYEAEGLKALSMPRIGFGWGEYKRHAGFEEFKADTKNVYYGITNEVRKDIPVGPITLEPTAEFNVLGLHQGQTKEDNNLEINSSNNVSVEGGIGLYAKKTFMIREKDELKVRVGGTYYHEFNNPYQAAKARISGMAGSYQMDSYDADRDRAVLSCRLDYKHEEFDFFFEANKYLERDDGYALNAGVGYRF